MALDSPRACGAREIQPADFSRIVGVVQIAAVAKPGVVAVDEPLTLTVTITGQAVAPYLPKRDHLRIFPDDVQRDFYIEPVREQSRAGSWEFVYHLRPKHARVQFVPGLKLVYYAPQQRRYQSAYADAIPLTVNPRQEAVVDIKGLKVIQAPPSFFELADEDTTDQSSATALIQQAPQIPLRLALLPPLLCIVGAWWWRRRRRSHADRAHRRQQLVEQTVAALAKPPCDAALTTRLLTIYLRQRLDFPAAEPTPIEVERWLKRRGVAKPIREEWRLVLQGYDALRFAPGQSARSAVDGSEAAELIRALEDQECLAAR